MRERPRGGARDATHHRVMHPQTRCDEDVIELRWSRSARQEGNPETPPRDRASRSGFGDRLDWLCQTSACGACRFSRLRKGPNDDLFATPANRGFVGEAP